MHSPDFARKFEEFRILNISGSLHRVNGKSLYKNEGLRSYGTSVVSVATLKEDIEKLCLEPITL